MLRDEIADEVNDALAAAWNGETVFGSEIADRILALPEMVELQEKAKKWDENEYCLQEWWQKECRGLGWLHRGDLIEGLVVEERCPQGYRDVTGRVITSEMHPELCEVCHGTGTVSRPLTVGEWCNIRSFKHQKDSIPSIYLDQWLDRIILPNGGRVRVK